MCFNIHPNWPKMQTATEDIPVFKMLNTYRRSPYQFFQYPPAGHKLVLDWPQWYRTTQRVAKRGYYYSLYQGFHSLKLPKFEKWRNEAGEFEFHAVIPKGAQYMENYSEYVSNALIVYGIAEKPRARKKPNTRRTRAQRSSQKAAR